MPDTTAHQTIVRNTSGVEKFFAFLGANGVTLAADEDYAHPGDLFTRWMNDTLQTAALKYALDNGLLTILKTPDVFVYDETDERVYRLGADNGTPVVADPDYGSYSGPGPDV